MLSVPNRTTWNGYFARSTIKNCGVEIRNKYKTLLFDGHDIVEFTYSGSNSYVCSSLPHEEINFTAINFSKMSSSLKGYVVKKAVFRVSYIVEGTSTTNGKLFVVENVDIDIKKDRVSIKLLSFFDYAIGNYDHQLLGRAYNGTITSQATSSARLLSMIPQIGSTPVVAGSIDRDVTLLPVGFTNITQAQAIQNLAIACGCGINLHNLENANNYYNELICRQFLPNSVDLTFNSINVYDNANVEDYETDYSNIVYMAKFPVNMGSSQGISVTLTPKDGHLEGEYVYDFDSKDAYYCQFDFVSRTIPTGEEFVTIAYSDKVVLQYFQSQAPSLVFDIKLRDARENKRLNNGDGVLKCWFYTDVNGVNVDVQNDITSYFSHNQYLEFDCRIDPTIEPLDIIEVEMYGISYKIAVEDLTINFNGGFTGNIKGRIIDTSAVPTKIVINGTPDQWFERGEAFTFGTTVTVTYGDGTTATKQASDLSFSGYDMSTQGKYNVVVSYTEGGVTVSTNYEIWVEYLDEPIISDLDVENEEFKITNPNPVECTVEVEWSSHLYSIAINPFETLTISSSQYAGIHDPFVEYENYLLEYDLYCYLYEIESSTASDNTIILEANY